MAVLSKVVTELIDLLAEKDEMITRQGEIIARLLNENIEKENYIQAVIQEDA